MSQGPGADCSSWLSLLTVPNERRKTVYSCGAMFAQQINGILFFYGVRRRLCAGHRHLAALPHQPHHQHHSDLCGGRLGLARQSRAAAPQPLATTAMMFFAFIIIGGIGTRPINTASQYVIVIFSYVIVVTFNFGLGRNTVQ